MTADNDQPCGTEVVNAGTEIWCDRYEAIWQQSESADLRTFLSACQRESRYQSLQDTERRRLLAELVRIDLWRRWSLRNDCIDTTRGECDSTATRQLPDGPRLAHYDKLLDSVLSPFSVDLLAAEYEVRLTCGDHPNALEYLRQSGDALHELAVRLEEISDEQCDRAPWLDLRVYRDQTLEFQQAFRAPVELGRQATDEPAPYLAIPQQDVYRIILAFLNERDVSFRHARLEQAENDRILLTNLSAKRSIPIEKQQPLPPGRSLIVSAPILFHLGARWVRAERPPSLPTAQTVLSTQSDAAHLSMETAVTKWIDLLKAGNELAAQQLWERYFPQFEEVARRQLNKMPQFAQDAEDVALSAMKSLFVGARSGRFPDVRSRDNLWWLLLRITKRKAISHQRRLFSAKRHPRRLDGQLAARLPLTDELAAGRAAGGVEREISSSVDELLAALQDDLRTVALLKLDGRPNADIARQTGVTPRTVERKLNRIRTLWSVALTD